MEIKDYIFSLGILSSVIFSLLTLLLGYKNRRNTLREHLYKEQISFFAKFLLNVNKLNFEIESLINNPSKRHSNRFYELLENVNYDYYNYEFLIPSEISGSINNLIFKSNQFYMAYLSMKDDEITKSYSTYFNTYTNMLNYIKEFIGVKKLSQENKLLYTNEDNKRINNIVKFMVEISEKTQF